MAITLNILGILFILASLMVINRTDKGEKEIYESIVSMHRDVKYYHGIMEDILTSFDELIEESLAKLDKLQSIDYQQLGRIKSNEVCDIQLEEKMARTNDGVKIPDKNEISFRELRKKIHQLNREGLSKEEIAKTLNKSVREIEVILKIWSDI
ncbi:hypothetical protein [Tepidimicrobium xylanilyticum]|uniref:Uncharacterized protein n=1 Tax=Tepidimicrobium xylanilyticum TaxID=1123352 RepID=A0A1H2YD59_9FIRM|nr:hypothetical protein [Tepidimicrobium xylanilyticum]GMG97110.1 hypothetical protein EN5CB1_19360 [Tepidimicrobium xylanilyticum]SDX03097.1 hypothetical protein SAMN05660923_01591 [Tepidimicrobium xylanilyticum]